LVKSMRIENYHNLSSRSSDEFKTDTEISSNGKSKEGLDLVAADSTWITPSANNDLVTNSRFDALRNPNRPATSNTSYNKESNPGLNGTIGEWDQFRANEQLFSVRASYDENLYTTQLDKTQMDDVQIRRAERLAREIEGSVSTNMHIAEERGQKVEGDYDEEDKYSGVLRSNTNNNTTTTTTATTSAWKTRPLTAPAAISAEKKPKEPTPSTTTAAKPATETKPKESTATPTPAPTPIPAVPKSPVTQPPPKKNYASVAAAALSSTTFCCNKSMVN
jgi:PAB1-binding protein PBP1